MTQTFEQVDPRTVDVGPNVRLDPRLDRQFIASVRERGVLEPVLLYRDGGGTLTVLAGQRRTLAAQQTQQATIPALISDQPPADADRLVDQWVENEHRAGLSNSERIAAVEQMTLAGLSDHQIAKRTATPKAVVQAAKAAAQAPTLRVHADQLTLDQAAALAEFEDDPDAVDALLAAAGRGQFDHLAQRLRNDRADAAQRSAFAATLTAQGITVVDRPAWGDRTAAALDRLADADGQTLTVTTHADCPGHAAYVDTAWRYLDTDHNAEDDAEPKVEGDNETGDDETGDEADDGADGDIDDGDDVEVREPGRLSEPVEVYVARYVCTDYQAHGHRDRWATSSRAPAKKRAADMNDDEREAARAARRQVIESNKAWKACTDVRRGWLRTFAARRTAPAGTETYLAHALTHGWTERPSPDAFDLAGFTAPADTPHAYPGYHQQHAVTDALSTATSKRALQIGLALTLATWETRTTGDTWRNPGQQTVLTLTRLGDWGYPLSEIEQQMIRAAQQTEPELGPDPVHA